MSFKSGYVSIIGRPNAGKSTLLNALVGEKIAIVTQKPQTTRNRILGIVHVPARKGRPAGQVILVDTPGVHKPDSVLNKKMMQEVHDALEDRDLVLVIVDATERFGRGDEFVLDLVKRAGGRSFLLLNKIDLVDKQRLLPLIEQYSKLHNFDEIIPISAAKGQGLDELLNAIVKVLPNGPHFFPADQITDQPERFLAAEIIREKILQHAAQEVPYATTVVVDQYKEEGKLTRIAATIYCEREGQKRILIGKGGENMKKIGSAARFEIERMAGTRVFLELFVKVREDWRQSRQFVEELDWRKQLEQLGGKANEHREDAEDAEE
jgi:GTP-binding protein Era